MITRRRIAYAVGVLVTLLVLLFVFAWMGTTETGVRTGS